jgi:hypothetical protein
MSKFKFILCLICILMMIGCAPRWTKRYDKNMGTLDRGGIVLFTVTSEYKSYKGDKLFPKAFFTSKKGSDKYTAHNYRHDKKSKVGRDESGEFWLVMLKMEKNIEDFFFYKICGNVLGFFDSFFEAPILMNFQAKKNEVTYLGNINLILRKKSSDTELRAGPVIPLLQQLSIINKTFDVVISDKYERDIKQFEKEIKGFKTSQVVKRILPPWEKPSSEDFKPKKTPLGIFGGSYPMK